MHFTTPKPKISIAIPCYEMRGQGAEMLLFSLSTIRQQDIDYRDFEVVVADHSINDDIYDVCNSAGSYLNIVYTRNPEKRGSSSANMNCAIKNCSGRLIKIICQDDFLFRVDSLEQTINNFDYNKKWLVSAYYHTYDRQNLFGYHRPELSSKIYIENKIGTHSCLTILNEDPLLFNESLLWFMDCEYYYRLYLKYGEPTILNEATFAQLLWDGQVTNTLINPELVEKEEKYLNDKYAGK